jgi:hypothetical protein
MTVQLTGSWADVLIEVFFCVRSKRPLCKVMVLVESFVIVLVIRCKLDISSLITSQIYLSYFFVRLDKSNSILARRQWLTPVIVATQEAEVRRSWFKAGPGK